LDLMVYSYFFFSSRRRHTRFSRDWSSDVCSSDLENLRRVVHPQEQHDRGGDRAEGEFEIPPVLDVDRKDRAGEQPQDRGEDGAEIGRASCRERVEIREVAGACNKERTERRKRRPT